MGDLIKHTQCPKCAATGQDNSKDNLAVYSDGSKCFSCGYSEKVSSQFIRGQITDLPARKLYKEALGRYGIQTKNYTGHIRKDYFIDEPIIIFPIYKEGKRTGQKIRLLSDSRVCTQMGDCKDADLGGLQAFTPSDRVPLVICEAELDAVSINQVLGYPAVYTGGSSAAHKKIAKHIDKIHAWKYVVLCFDSDEAGQEAVEKCISLFKPGFARVAHLPLKDANEMLQANRVDELKKCIWNAEIRKPRTIVTIEDIKEKVLKKPQRGIPWPYEMLDKATCGLRDKEIYVLAAAEGVGKTEFIKEIIYHLIDNKVKVGVFSFEQDPESTVQRLIGGKVNKRLHLPTEEWWDEEVINNEMDKMLSSLYLYDNRGTLDLDSVMLNIRYMVRCFGVKFFVIDNLTAMCSETKIDGRNASDSEYVGYVMGHLHSLVKELGISVMVVSHLNSDRIQKSMYISKNAGWADSEPSGNSGELVNKAGTTWDSGRMPTMDNIFGSGKVRKLADYVIVLSRNTVSDDDEERRTTRVKFLKTRFDSSFTGQSFRLYYNYNTGRLEQSNNADTLKQNIID